MIAIYSFLFHTILTLILLLALIIVLLGSAYVIKVIVMEWFGYKFDLFQRGKHEK